MEKLVLHPNVFILEDFLTKTECLHFINVGEKAGFEAAKVQVGGAQQSLITGIRNNERVEYNNQRLADELWKRFETFAPVLQDHQAVGLNEMFRFYKYTPGQRFKMHRDGNFTRNTQERSFYTFLMYLNDDFDGGGTEFKDLFTVSPKQGSLLVFFHPLKHEGKILTAGTKYVLRSDIMYRLQGTGN